MDRKAIFFFLKMENNHGEVVKNYVIRLEAFHF